MMSADGPESLHTAKRKYSIRFAAMLTLFFVFFVFCASVPSIDRSDGQGGWYPRTQMNLFYWRHTPSGVSLKFSYQLGASLLWNQGDWNKVQYNRGIRQFPSLPSHLISAMYVRDHWLSADSYPPEMRKRFVTALAEVTDEREAYCLGYCFEKATTSGRVLWLGVLRNLAVLMLIVCLAISMVKASRASTDLRAIKLALRKSSCICGYSLVGLTTNTCPECGRTVAVLAAQPPTTINV